MRQSDRVMAMTPSRDLSRLLEIMERLRTPETGCPWDLEQDFRSIAPYTVEEAYEVVDAIERNDFADLKDELGDLLLQVVFHARIAEEQQAFVFADVVEAITTKLIRRHPHVFGSTRDLSPDEVKALWGRIKDEEKADKAAARRAAGQVVDEKKASRLDGVPLALPALSRAVKLQDKAAKVGFDWPDVSHVFDKLVEECGELRAAQAEDDPAGMAEEMGDLLFVMANLARHMKIDPEQALRASNAKFYRRFNYIEEKLQAIGRTPEQSGLAEMDALWNEVRALDKRRDAEDATLAP